MALPTKGDEVGSASSPRGASPSHVVNIKVSDGSAFLTPPTVAFQDGTMQHRIKPRHRSNSRSFFEKRNYSFRAVAVETVCS